MILIIHGGQLLMAKKRLKPEAETVYFHAMTRTAQGVYWLKEPEVKEIYKDLIDCYSKIYYVEIMAHSCMSNHTHLVLKIQRPKLDPKDIETRFELAQTHLARPRKFREHMVDGLYKKYTDISRFMWEINRRMALRHNEMKETKGHLWGGRFKSVVVEPGEHLLRVMTYVELNSVRAGIVEDPAKFRYSSVGNIAKQLQDNDDSSQEATKKWVKTPKIPMLEQLPEEIRAQTYVDFMRYVAQTNKEGPLRGGTLPIQFTSLGIEVNMKAILEALATREPGNWTNLTYGSTQFERQTLERAGWLIPMSSQQEASQKARRKAA